MYIMSKRIALDIDGVLANFSGGVVDKAKELGIEFIDCPSKVTHWDMHPNFSKVMKNYWGDPEFWLNLQPLRSGNLPFVPHVYITSRPIDTEITRQWLIKHGFPSAPVITVKHPKEKLQHIENMGIDILIDDLHHTVREVIESGRTAFLYKAPYQRGHEEECKGLPTIETLEEILYV
jgi:uncharacterized HAD superfamily protein